jgi:5-methyltetrahydrofolate--homocysteine methyltransferase
MAVLEEIKDNLIRGQYKKVEELVTQAINENISPEEILNKGLIAGMEVVGEKFKANEFYIPEVLIAARAMHAGMKVLKPLLAKSNVKAKGRIVMGTVKGDLHDIGKNLVCMMLEGAGFEVIDLGVDVSPEKFVAVVRERAPQVVGLSALLTTTMVNMKTTIEVFKKEGVYDKIKVIVGGAPVTQSFADQIGAHGYAPDAASAVDKVKELLNIQN